MKLFNLSIIALSLTTVVSMGFAAAVPSMSKSNDHLWYVGARGAVNVPTKNTYNTGYAGFFEIGRWFHNIAVEAELGYLFNGRNHVSGEERKAIAMLNAYYGFKNSTQFVPYLGLGVGSGYIRNSSGIQDRFAYQGIIGLAYNFNSRWSMSLDYRYFNVSHNIAKTPRIGSNLFTLGLDYHF